MITARNLKRARQKQARESAQKIVAEQIDSAVDVLTINIRALERIKKDLYDDSLGQGLEGIEEVAEDIQSRVIAIIGTVSGNFAWKLNLNFHTIVIALTPIPDDHPFAP